jgi:hypothetical protein
MNDSTHADRLAAHARANGALHEPARQPQERHSQEGLQEELTDAELEGIAAGGVSLGGRGTTPTTQSTRPGTSTTTQDLQVERPFQPATAPR